MKRRWHVVLVVAVVALWSGVITQSVIDMERENAAVSSFIPVPLNCEAMRLTFMNNIQRRYNAGGLDIRVYPHGPRSRRLTVDSPLASKAKFQAAFMREFHGTMQILGFVEVRFYSAGPEYTTVYNPFPLNFLYACGLEGD